MDAHKAVPVTIHILSLYFLSAIETELLSNKSCTTYKSRIHCLR